MHVLLSLLAVAAYANTWMTTDARAIGSEDASMGVMEEIRRIILSMDEKTKHMIAQQLDMAAARDDKMADAAAKMIANEISYDSRKQSRKRASKTRPRGMASFRGDETQRPGGMSSFRGDESLMHQRPGGMSSFRGDQTAHLGRSISSYLGGDASLLTHRDKETTQSEDGKTHQRPRGMSSFRGDATNSDNTAGRPEDAAEAADKDVAYEIEEQSNTIERNADGDVRFHSDVHRVNNAHLEEVGFEDALVKDASRDEEEKRGRDMREQAGRPKGMTSWRG